MPFALFRTAGHALMGSVMKSFTKEELDYFHFGCGLDTTRMRTELGFEPRWTTRDALDDFARGIGLTRVIEARMGGQSRVDGAAPRAGQTRTEVRWRRERGGQGDPAARRFASSGAAEARTAP